MEMKRGKPLGLMLLIIISLTLMTGCGFSYVINATNRLDRR
jgi:hypothetical protein